MSQVFKLFKQKQVMQGADLYSSLSWTEDSHSSNGAAAQREEERRNLENMKKRRQSTMQPMHKDFLNFVDQANDEDAIMPVDKETEGGPPTGIIMQSN